MKETLNFTLQVNPAAAAFQVVDANGAPLADGATVALVAESLGIADPGQTLFTVKGGTPPYQFAITSGAVPAGDALGSTINADGSETVSISGTPTAPGAAAFAVSVSDSAGAAATVGVRRIR